ncbi:hypothetical protein ACCO45_011632 [Purpureocillium lilacinum]|uniref:Uncharacterized protein n=1 Tax=Purpureocillium lilacinum TaxID=33203 RepID=A0ACC4DBP8_PURLI
MADLGAESVVSVEYRGRVAVITIDNDKKLNALGQLQYYALARAMQEVAKHDEVFVTVILAKGRYFSAPALSFTNLRRRRLHQPRRPRRRDRLAQALALHLRRLQPQHHAHLRHAPQGPRRRPQRPRHRPLRRPRLLRRLHLRRAPRLPPHPFSSIGLVAEGGASRALVQRLGPAKANEALIMSKRLWAKELLDAGYLNEIFDYPKGEDAAFRDRVLKEVDERLGDHLNGESLVGIKKLIRRPELETIHNANVHEVFAGLDRFVKGIPQEEFRKLASGEEETQAVRDGGREFE